MASDEHCFARIVWNSERLELATVAGPYTNAWPLRAHYPYPIGTMTTLPCSCVNVAVVLRDAKFLQF